MRLNDEVNTAINHQKNSGPDPLGRSRAGIPLIAEADVVGGGPGGFAAALRASREGCRVALIERFDMPGGAHTSGLQGAANPGVGGIHTELMDRFAAGGCIYTADEKSLPHWAGNPLSHYDYYLAPGSPFQRSSFNPDGAGCIMLRMLEEAGVNAMYGASFVDVELEKDGAEERITEAIIETVSGRRACAEKSSSMLPALPKWLRVAARYSFGAQDASPKP